MRTYLQAFPLMSSQLLYYQSMMCQYAQQFTFEDAYTFDRNFRMRLANNNKFLRWDRHYQELVAKFLNNHKPVCFKCKLWALCYCLSIIYFSVCSRTKFFIDRITRPALSCPQRSIPSHMPQHITSHPPSSRLEIIPRLSIPQSIQRFNVAIHQALLWYLQFFHYIVLHRGVSINDGILKEDFTVRYTSFDDAVDLVHHLGKDCQLGKIDIKHAFHLCRLAHLIGHC